MPGFSYSAIDQSGKSARGWMEAMNEIDLELRLKHMGLDLVTFRTSRTRFGLFRRASASPQDLILFCFELEQLVRAGVPLLQGLVDLRDSLISPVFRKIVGQLIPAIEGGLTLSQAMAQHPEIFRPVFIGLVRTGEQTGKLADVFEQLSATLKWQHEILAQTRRLLAYPLFILAVVLASAMFLMMYLVPQMAVFLKNMGQAVPPQTQFMLWLSAIMMRWWWACLPVPPLLAGAAALAVRHIPAVRYRCDSLLLLLPFTGSIAQKAIMARFARYFALMYQAGIPILSALDSCREIVGNRFVADRLEQACHRINAGESVSEGLHGLGFFPPLVIRMIRIGENTGTLDSALLNVSYFYELDVKNSSEKMLKLLEPALTVLLGGLLALIMFSVLGPVYNLMTEMRF